jgi:hypothetical protein
MTRNYPIKDTDRGYRKLIKRIDGLARRPLEVVVGVLGSDAEKPHRSPDGESEATIVEIALWHEVGAGVPRRSWLRDWYDEERDQNIRRIRVMARNALKAAGGDERKALEIFGIKAVASIRRRIKAGIAPPLSEVTIDRKGSATPLIDKAQFIQSISWEVRS